MDTIKNRKLGSRKVREGDLETYERKLSNHEAWTKQPRMCGTSLTSFDHGHAPDDEKPNAGS